MSATTMAVAVAVETVGRNTPLAFAVVMVRPTPQYAACLYYRREVNAFQPDLRLFPVQTCPWIRRFMGWLGIVASPAREHHGRRALASWFVRRTGILQVFSLRVGLPGRAVATARGGHSHTPNHHGGRARSYGPVPSFPKPWTIVFAERAADELQSARHAIGKARSHRRGRLSG